MYWWGSFSAPSWDKWKEKYCGLDDQRQPQHLSQIFQYSSSCSLVKGASRSDVSWCSLDACKLGCYCMQPKICGFGQWLACCNSSPFIEHRQLESHNSWCLTFKNTAIAYGQKISRSLKLLLARYAIGYSSSVHKTSGHDANSLRGKPQHWCPGADLLG